MERSEGRDRVDEDQDVDDDGPHRAHRTGETSSERHTRQISELLLETRVAAVGIQVILGFLLAVPFQSQLEGAERDAHVVAVMAGMLATALLLAPSVLHRALLHRGQAVWLVEVGTKMMLAGALATSVSLAAAALLVGERLYDDTWRLVPMIWTIIVLALFWLLVPIARNVRLNRAD